MSIYGMHSAAALGNSMRKQAQLQAPQQAQSKNNNSCKCSSTQQAQQQAHSLKYSALCKLVRVHGSGILRGRSALGGPRDPQLKTLAVLHPMHTAQLRRTSLAAGRLVAVFQSRQLPRPSPVQGIPLSCIFSWCADTTPGD